MSNLTTNDVSEPPPKAPLQKERPKAAPPPKPKAEYVFHARRILDVIVLVLAVCTLLLSRISRPGFWTTVLYALITLPAGLVLSFLFYSRKRQKQDIVQLYNVHPGVKGLTELLNAVPTWVTLGHSEKCEWMNAFLLETWPFYDLAVCEMIKETMEPIFDTMKVPPISHLGFAKLQFGDAPIRIEAVRMNRERKDGVYLEFDFRWAGEPEIKLSASTFGSDSVSLCPKISKIRMFGTLGVQLRPLVDEIPGFGAVLVTLVKPPKLSYKVDLGAALGGNITGGAVAAFVDGLIPSLLDGFLIWPQRIVVPLFDEKVIGPMENLMLRERGIIKVQVLEARDIPRMDRMGTSDPLVQLFTDPKRRVTTTRKSNTLNPVWENEIHYLMVQEPETQYLRFEMFDVDIVNPKALLKINPIKGLKESVRSKETMCKGEVSLKGACVDNPGETLDRWFPLGSEDWSSDDGPGKDCGELKLRMTYVPLTRSNPMVGDYGALFVYVKKARDFPRMEPEVPNSCNPYFVGKVGDQKEKSTVQSNTTEPDWTGTSIQFYNISNTEKLKLKFSHSTALADEDLGYVHIEVGEVRKSKNRDLHGCLEKEYELQDADSGSVQIEVLFVAYF